MKKTDKIYLNNFIFFVKVIKKKSFYFSRISDQLGTCLPNLDTLILTGNMLQDLTDIDPLTSLPKLVTLSLMHCPVVTKPHYREYVAFKLPNLRLLDFRKIRQKVSFFFIHLIDYYFIFS